MISPRSFATQPKKSASRSSPPSSWLWRRRSFRKRKARLYADFVATFVLDDVDRKQAAAVEKFEMRPVVTNTVMRGLRERRSLARVLARELEIAS